MKKRNRRILSLTMSWILTLSILLSGMMPAFAEGEFDIVPESTTDISQDDNSGKAETVPEVPTGTSIDNGDKAETVPESTTGTSIDNGDKAETVPESTTGTGLDNGDKTETVPEDTLETAQNNIDEVGIMTMAITPGTDWYNEADTSFTLTTAEQMYGFAKLVNDGNTFAGKTVKLGDTIDLTQLSSEGGETEKNQWTPIGTSAKPFKGIFDGGSNKVKIYINSPNTSYQGLFGYINGATIKGVTVEGEITGGQYNGGVVGYVAFAAGSPTRITDCTNRCAISATSQVGGIAGYIATAATATRHNITNCKNYGDISGTSQVGGIVGQTVNFCNYEGCENYGAILGTKDTVTYVGGIAGQGGTYNSFTGCNNKNTVKGVQYVGGIVGGSTTYGNFTGCKNEGSITGTGDTSMYVGGIAGSLAGTSTVEKCENNGSITGGNQIGGIVGLSTGTNIKGCTNVEKISGTSYVGGIIGSAESAGSIQWSVVTGNVSGKDYVGGLVGYGKHTGFYLQDSYVLSDITGENNYIGGLAGLLMGNSSKNCFYYQDGDKGVTGRQNVSMLHSGLPSAPNLYYLSETLSNQSAKTASEFKKNVVLNLLQKNADSSAGNYWEQGERFPQITKNSQTSLYKVSLTNRVPGISETNKKNFVKLAEPKDDEYTVYGTTGAAYTYVPEGTELTLDVTLAEGFKVTFYPSDAVTVTEAAIVTEGAIVTEAAIQKDDEAAVQYIYSIKVGRADVAVEYLFSKKMTESDYAWYDEAAQEFTISTEAQLLGLAYLVNNKKDFAGKKISLDSDIELAGGLFMPIGKDVNTPFNGTFDGCDHAIRGLMASYKMEDGTNLKNTALFGFAGESAVIKNLTVEGKVDGERYSAGVVAYNKGTISKVTNQVSVSSFWNQNLREEYYAGGISAYSEGTITDCTNEGALTALGAAIGTTTKDDKGKDIPASERMKTKGFFGGIAGSSIASISESENHGEVTGEWANIIAGGIVGQSGAKTVITGSLNTGKVYFVDLFKDDQEYQTKLAVGGIAGSGGMIKQCKNSGSIYGYDAAVLLSGCGAIVGGICGIDDDRILESVNTGSVYGAGTNVVVSGGILGVTRGMVENSYNLGPVKLLGASNQCYAGGLIGKFQPSTAPDAINVAIINSYNAGTVIAPTGIVSGAVVGSDWEYNSEKNLASYYNTYYLGSLGLKAVKGEDKSGVTPQSHEEMQEAAFAEILGRAFSATADSYPTLQWEGKTPVVGDYVIFNYKESSFYDLGHELGVVGYKESDTFFRAALGEDGKVIRPEEPKRTNFEFLGWYKDLDHDAEPFDFSTEIDSGATLYAKWKVAERNVTFHYEFKDEEGKEKQTFVLKHNEKIDALALEREGYELLGWFLKDKNGDFAEVPYDFPGTVTKDLDLYAQWQKINFDYRWYDPEAKDLNISTVEELFAFARLVNGSAPKSVTAGAPTNATTGGVEFTGVTVHLKKDIDMSEWKWSTPIGAGSSTPFKGIFDGEGHKIQGITMVGNSNLGLFGYLKGEGSKIKDLTMSGSVQGKNYIGVVAACASDTVFENVTNNVKVKGSSYVGGIVGYCKDSAFTNCVNNATVTATDGSYVGGITGYASYSNDAKAFAETDNYGEISGTNQVGGIVGYLALENVVVFGNKNISLSQCRNYGEIHAMDSYAGGIVGCGNYVLGSYFMYLTFKDCSNDKKISSGGLYAGGIAGRMGAETANARAISNFTDCKNKGDVEADSYAGGISGAVQSERDNGSKITQCINEGAITAKGKDAQAGGIAANIGWYSSLSDLSNSGTISSNGGAGGIAASIGQSSTCSNLTNSGTVSGVANVGGIVAICSTSDEFRHISNTGDVTSAGDVSGKVYVGGIAGSLSVNSPVMGIPMNIEDCSNSGTVFLGNKAEKDVGAAGLIGCLTGNNANLIKCYNTGNVISKGNAGYVGGLVGCNLTAKSNFSIISCYNVGNIMVSSNNTYAGGIVGYLKPYNPITNTYNAGTISGPDKTQYRLGAISGDKDNNNVSDSYYLKNCVQVSDQPVVPADVSFATEKPAIAFQSGQVSYILDKGDTAARKGLWSQDKEYPVFQDEKHPLVYKASVSVSSGGAISYEPSTSDQYWYIQAGKEAKVTIEEKSGNVLRLISAKDTGGNKLGTASGASLGDDKVFTFTMPACGVLINADFIPEVTEPHEVTFISEGNKYETQTVKPNQAAVPPKPPTKESSGGDDYVFAGWYTEPALTDLYDFNTVVTENITLYAKFKVARLVDVSFDLNYTGATGAPENQKVKQGNLLYEPPAPTRMSESSGGTEIVKYTFLGWYTASSISGVKWDFKKDFVPSDTGDTMTLYAHWEAVDALKGENIEISDLSTLKRLAENVRNGEDYKGTTFILEDNIELDDSWKGIGTANNPFNGTFDGNGKTITITKIKEVPYRREREESAEKQHSIFFEIGEGGVVENLKVDGELSALISGITNINRGTIRKCKIKLDTASSFETFTGDFYNVANICVLGGAARVNYGLIDNCEAQVDLTCITTGVGGFAAINETGGTISDCHLADSNITAYRYFGGICGMNKGTISGCTVKDTTLVGVVVGGQGTDNCGGIVGSSYGGKIENCRNYAELIGGSEKYGSKRFDSIQFGGIAGSVFNGVVTDCENYGLISKIGNCGGGIVGILQGEVSDCHNYGEVSETGSNIYSTNGRHGGIVGEASNSVIEDCTNEGKVSGTNNIGGIVGNINGNKITKCTNTEEVIATSSFAGGIAGRSQGKSNIDQCASRGDVNGLVHIGGIVGSLQDEGKISNCYGTGLVKGSVQIGGIVGYNISTESINNCMYYNTAISRDVEPISGGNDSTREKWSKCYYVGGKNGTSGAGTGMSAAAFASGEVAYLLDVYEGKKEHNEIWTQGEKHPIFGKPSYYQVKVSVEGETGHGSAEISKDGTAYQTASLYMPLKENVYYLAKISADKTEAKDPTTGATTTVSYSLGGITLKHEDGSPDEELTGKGLASSINLSGDVELVVKILKKEEIIQPKPEPEQKPEKSGGGKGHGKGHGTGEGEGEGDGPGKGEGDGPGTGILGDGPGSGLKGEGSGGTTGSGNILSPVASIGAPENGEPEGAMGESSQGGGSPEGTGGPDEMKSPIEKKPDSVYTVADQVKEALKNPIVLALTILSIGAIFAASIFLSYKKRRRI